MTNFLKHSGYVMSHFEFRDSKKLTYLEGEGVIQMAETKPIDGLKLKPIRQLYWPKIIIPITFIAPNFKTLLYYIDTYVYDLCFQNLSYKHKTKML